MGETDRGMGTTSLKRYSWEEGLRTEEERGKQESRMSRRVK